MTVAGRKMRCASAAGADDRAHDFIIPSRHLLTLVIVSTRSRRDRVESNLPEMQKRMMSIARTVAGVGGRCGEHDQLAVTRYAKTIV